MSKQQSAAVVLGAGGGIRGGWYADRASKAALNQFVRTAAIELRRRNPETVCVALHPGTVDTPLSEPFQARVPERQLFDRQHAARQLLAVLDGLDARIPGLVCLARHGDSVVGEPSGAVCPARRTIQPEA